MVVVVQLLGVEEQVVVDEMVEQSSCLERSLRPSNCMGFRVKVDKWEVARFISFKGTNTKPGAELKGLGFVV